eukprot:TRINITY_DN1748_c0_g1_i1.p1 TRINITY_DN1748_c0_g1~~TRINITY_DN1748_c0_g1_i1.p1  ORF type:complete len:119 (-),score=6.81 TRINITY_DN1748_c0_g1_i1:150-470(-)
MEQEEGANKTPSSGTRKPYDPFAFLHQPWKAPCYHESVVWGFVPSMSYISYKWFVYGEPFLSRRFCVCLTGFHHKVDRICRSTTLACSSCSLLWGWAIYTTVETGG